MADAQDLKIHFRLFQLVAHHRLPHAQTIDNKWVLSVHAFFHSVEKGRGSDLESSTKSSTDRNILSPALSQVGKLQEPGCSTGRRHDPHMLGPISLGRCALCHCLCCC